MTDNPHDGSQKLCGACNVPLLPANNFTVLECPKCGYFEPVVVARPPHTPDKLISDKRGSFILADREDGHGPHPVAQMRGWGYLSGIGGLKLPEQKAIDTQLAWQEEIVKRYNAFAGVQDLVVEIAELREQRNMTLSEVASREEEIAALKADLTETITFRNELEEAYHHLLAETKQLRANQQVLVDALKQAIEGMADMIDYVPGYFRKKWKHDDCITEAREALNKIKESE